jgi:hypothetical protein
LPRQTSKLNDDTTPDQSPRRPQAKEAQARRGSDSGATPKGGASPTIKGARDSALSIKTGESPVNDDATPKEESKSK